MGGSILIFIILAIVILAINIWLLIFTYREGEKRKIGGLVAALLFLVFSLLGLIVVLISPKKDEYL